MDFHSKAAQIVLTARVWAHKLDGAQVFDQRKIIRWTVAAVFCFTCVIMWADENSSFVANPVDYGSKFQEQFVVLLFSAAVTIVGTAVVYYGTFAIIVLTSMGPVTCRNMVLEKFAQAGNWAAALELAHRFAVDPVQRNYWENKARQLGYNDRR